MQRIEFLTVETFAHWCAQAAAQGLAYTATELPHGGFTVTITGY